MGDSDGASKILSAPPRPPTIALPPRSSFESLFNTFSGAGGGGLSGFSPGPMTLVSNFFSEPYPDSEYGSFSQLLAGAMASPVAQIPGVRPTSIFPDSSSAASVVKETKSGDGDVKNSSGFKQNRPMSLVVAANSPMFMIPSGLSPSGLLSSPGFFSPGPSPFGMSHQQALAHVTAQAALAHSFQNMRAEYEQNVSSAPAESSEQEQQISTLMSDQEGSRMESPEVSQFDKKPQSASYPIDKPANDGYNWRKYGQKQVKASEFPRSYYKCTQSNCPARKKVGRSLDGVISDIIYKGKHNHEPPQPNKRSKGGADIRENRNFQPQTELAFQSQAEVSRSEEALPSQQVPGNNQVSSELIVLEENDDSRTRLHEADNDEPNAKRRNKEVGQIELSASHKTVTEAKIVVQTRSEVDLLDDGYKWRKYGQKVVKGNPYPRSYYKCTFTGCNVRKHVERASADPKSVVTTYEGKHNHEIPVARNRNYNIANNNGPQPKQEKGSILKSARHTENNYGNDQRPALLQLKEEQITA